MITRMRSCIEIALHPVLLGASLVLVATLESAGLALLVALAVGYSVVTWCESRFPAHPEWHQSPRERRTVLAVSLVGFVLLGVFAGLYGDRVRAPLALVRGRLGFDPWPTDWPLAIQILLAFFSAELVFYSIHRGLHRSTLLWRVSGHGFHHAFRNMHAPTFIASHLGDLALLALPAALVAGALGASARVVAAAALLQTMNGLLAHANLRTRTPLIGLVLTTSDQHGIHHSSDLQQSNSNYGCNAILWDRLFGTFAEGPVQQTGIGPFEPTLLEKLMLPFREPRYVRTSPSAGRAHHPAGRDDASAPGSDG